MTGSTPASTCLLQSELDTPLTHLARKIGWQNAGRAWLRSAAAVEALASRIDDLGLSCAFRSRRSIYLPGNVLDAEGLHREFEARRKIGFRSKLMDRRAVKEALGFSVAAALVTYGNAEADPVQLLSGVWRHFRAEGGKLVSGFEAAHIDESRTRVRLTSADGRILTARHVVLCTGYEILAAYRPKGFKIISTWALATKPQARKLWKGRELLWEAADPYLYMRTTSDGRVITGGADEDFADEAKRDALIGTKAKIIARQAKHYFPGIDFTPDFAWTGNFGASPTGLPAIGLLPGFKRSYSVLGFGGNGITFSMLAAHIVSRTIMGVNDPDAHIFDS
jgi:glycine/D-amino acid oxidase-like deaminating enzyme